ncbi:MAG: hypothetical protein R2867_36940 [Caldilineaceae bacterium]
MQYIDNIDKHIKNKAPGDQGMKKAKRPLSKVGAKVSHLTNAAHPFFHGRP